MNYMPFVFFVLALTTLAFFLKERDKKGSVKALFYKIATSFFFLLIAFSAFLVNHNHAISLFFMLIFMGLVCGLIGDIVLDLKIMYNESSSQFQFAGMISFFTGHIFYMWALINYFGFTYFPLMLSFVIALIIIFVSVFIFKFKFKEHSAITYMYTIILSYFMTYSVSLMFKTNFSALSVLLAVGSAAFLLSDLVLAMTYYDQKDSKLMISFNHILYYLAQFCIAFSVLVMNV